MFTYFRTAGSATGDLTGGWDETVDGWVRAIGAASAPGAEITTLSSWNGTQYDCHLETELFQGNWWIYSCGEWIGYYPGPDSTTVDPEDKINFDLIDDGACNTDWYGEVKDTSPSNWTNANMGGGGYAHEGWAKAAFIREPGVQLNSTTWDWLDDNDLSGSGFDDSCYTADPMLPLSGSGGSGWTQWFYVGGPGGSNTNCD